MGDRKISETSPAELKRSAGDILEGMDVFHKAVKLRFLEGTQMEVTFQDGTVKRYDMSALYPKYPQLNALDDRSLFLKGRLMGSYGIVWNDELDIEVETIYQDGETVRKDDITFHEVSASAVASARAEAGISQKELAALSGIDQSDISKIERGVSNPSVATLERLARALDRKLSISFERK